MTAPSDETLRVEVAKLCGWRYVTTEVYFNKIYHPTATPPVGMCCGKHLSEIEAFRCCFEPHPEVMHVVPNYPASLDACREFEKTLTDYKQLTEYGKQLYKIMPVDVIEDHASDFNDTKLDYSELAIFAMAEPRQRCLAFLATCSPREEGIPK